MCCVLFTAICRESKAGAVRRVCVCVCMCICVCVCVCVERLRCGRQGSEEGENKSQHNFQPKSTSAAGVVSRCFQRDRDMRLFGFALQQTSRTVLVLVHRVVIHIYLDVLQ